MHRPNSLSSSVLQNNHVVGELDVNTTVFMLGLHGNISRPSLPYLCRPRLCQSSAQFRIFNECLD